jgi:hypothetical protein
MKAVQDLVAYFDRKGALSSRELKTILDQRQVASEPPPSGMHGLCGTPGLVHYFRITGTTEGQVWGTDVYTRDSIPGAAAVHAGLLKPGQTGVLRLTIMPGQPSYPGTTRNGVTTSDYADFPECWRLSAL